MEKLKFDSGIREFDLGCGVLRFNPADPNLYSRFLKGAEELKSLEKELTEKAAALQEDTDGAQVVALLVEADTKMKVLLGKVFGEENDFEKILKGVNLMAVATNGQRVVTNLLQALEPVLLEGAELCAREKTQAARQKAQRRRASQ